MPSQTWCHCPDCDQKGGLDEEGKPRGTAIPNRYYKAHTLRVERAEADRQAAERKQSALIDDAGAQLFTAALLDEGPDLDALPSKLWTSRADFQKLRAPYITPIAQTDISSTSSVDAIVEGVQRLMVSSEDFQKQGAPYITPTAQTIISSSSSVDPIVEGVQRLVVSDDLPPNSDPVEADTTLPPLITVIDDPDDPDLSARGIHLPHRRPGMNKKERSQYTANALAVLESVRIELYKCGQNLNSPSTSEAVEDARTVISNARRAIERTTRSTPDIEKLRAELVDKINNIEGQLLVLNAVSPQSHAKDGPKDYLTGK